MICPKCGTTIVEDSRFVICPKCGSMFDTIDVPAHLKTRPNRNNRPNDNYNRHTPDNKNVPVNEKPNHMKKFVIVVIIAGLALLIH